MSAYQQSGQETTHAETTSHGGEEIVDLEQFARDKKPVPPSKKYQIRIDKDKYVVDVPHMTGEEILKLACKTSAGYLLSMKVKGQMVPVAPNEAVDFTASGVERFATVPKEVQEGEGPVRTDFTMLEEDVEYLNSKGYTWEAVATDAKRVVMRGFQPPQGLLPTQVDAFVIIPHGYPDAQIDMVYFHPPLARADGAMIRALVSNEFEGKTWQGWSRHRTANSTWRQGVDNLATHMMLVDDFLAAELSQ
ncbi:multiubiquitin domain-containing protein [Cupriavidus plantarum]|uniref:multiubiquitin domain-containing protein n=1 Tax=Cupriavidus plantarum TaxID=942865 RepID=UPI00339D5D00